MVAQDSNASIPVSLLQSNFSHGACRTYGLLSLLPNENGRFWVSQGFLGTQLNCSTRHVRNFLGELEESGFLESTGDYYGQHRIYRLLRGAVINKPGSDDGEHGENKQEALKTLPVASRNSGTIVPQLKKLNSKLNLNLFNLGQSVSEAPQTQAQSLLVQNPDWETEFHCFDGKEGRPTLIQKVEEAIGRFNYGSLVGYVKHYLRNGAKWLLQGLTKLYNLAPEVQPASLEELAQERREQEAKRRAYNNRFLPKENIGQSEEDTNFIKEAFSRLTMGIRNNLTNETDLSFAV